MVEEEQNEDETNRQEVMAMRQGGRGGTNAKEWRERKGEPDRKQREEERQMIGTRNLK